MLVLLGERERAHLVMQPADFSIYIYIYIYLTDRVTYRIVLNVSTRFYFSAYATISNSLEPLASLLSLSQSTL